MSQVTVILFPTIHHLFRLEKALHDVGIACRPIAAPRELTSDCATALEVDRDARADVEALLVEAEIEYTGVYDL